MANPVELTPGLWVSGQVQPSDVADLVTRLGLARIINNRPDGEEPGQPESTEIQAAAETADVAYLSLPVRGMPDADAVAQMGEILSAEHPTLMFCRSGMRSTALWALARSGRGDDAEALRAAARAAGYDLSALPL